MKTRTRRRLFVLGVLAVVALPCVVAAYRRGTGNFGVIRAGRIYRSAQLDAASLERVIRERGVRTVLNLRGPNPEEAWYRDELAATLRRGATQIDVPLASDQWLARDQALELIEILDTCEYPILMHCEFGAERTGLVAAMSELLRPGSTIADARRQFSLEYLYVALRDGLVMQGHLDRYEAWLNREGVEHTPAAFRRWVAVEYRPESPSRQFWPCNPYPLSVITRPGGERSARWSQAACPERIAIEMQRPRHASR